MCNLSIITINFNNASGLKKSMDSVLNQSFKNFEYVVVDGKSIDGSIDIINSYKKDNFVKIIEEDSGIYNAMNKGIKIASGKYLLFLNSGDYLIDNTILEFVNNTLKLSESSFISFNLFLEENSKRIKRIHPERISFSYILRSTISHQSTFIKKALFDKYGLYNENFKITSDWEFFFKTIALNGESFKKIDKVLSVFSMDGISSKKDNFGLVQQEKETIKQKYLQSFYNNRLDEFLLAQIISPSKRVKILMELEKNLMLRKIATIVLKTLNIFNRKG